MRAIFDTELLSATLASVKQLYESREWRCGGLPPPGVRCLFKYEAFRFTPHLYALLKKAIKARQAKRNPSRASLLGHRVSQIS